MYGPSYLSACAVLAGVLQIVFGGVLGLGKFIRFVFLFVIIVLRHSVSKSSVMFPPESHAVKKCTQILGNRSKQIKCDKFLILILDKMGLGAIRKLR